MILVQHDFKKVTKVIIDQKSVAVLKGNISKVVMKLCQLKDNQLLVWIHESEILNLNTSHLSKIFHHNKIMASYATSNFLEREVGYIEESPFIKINREVSYPTWQMNSLVGGIHSSVIATLSGQIKSHQNFDYFLNSLAKLAMPQGVFCYSEPGLLLDKAKVKTETPKANTPDLFRFTAEHYRRRWTVMLLLNFILFEKKAPVFSWLFSFGFSRKRLRENSFESIPVQSIKAVLTMKEVDVIIPTIGRKAHLYNVLKDFSKQTVLPKSIIIVEQNPNKDSGSQLDYLYTEKWPFQIHHKFIHQTGVCNARNLALDEVSSEWTFLADDDIRIESDFLQLVFTRIEKDKVDSFLISCLQEGEKNLNNYSSQTTTFGSGCSIVKSEYLSQVRFNSKFEFGYGEDIDFGMQLRNKGCDVIFTPKPQILHLKAPVGGFRSVFKPDWGNEKIQPKPSPTILLFKLLHQTSEQLHAYKLNLFVKSLNLRKVLKMNSTYKKFIQQWNLSLKWALKLSHAS
ncbi:glycosyltransferase family 2 protein [Psychroflexus sp. YR1-1]|uniref:Glycosyltransferase family 2 protein n=1 Tax=Psychroflexus aurantiacus TaxID=2709310 RepID=A0A6B3R346_9FLAO|nr:glycosyltransferase family A protein [Psychroflexus aurantiacus]NEV93930.1 glycosyltransferase family 2 protein [Psychroflexus aurantiacus]